MAEIDEVIDRHGGWPGAFVTEPASQSGEGQKQEASPQAPAPKKEAKPAEDPGDQPWQMTRGEFHLWRVSQGLTNPTENSRLYWQEIKQAVAEGKPLQPSVLREYERLFGPRTR